MDDDKDETKATIGYAIAQWAEAMCTVGVFAVLAQCTCTGCIW